MPAAESAAPFAEYAAPFAESAGPAGGDSVATGSSHAEDDEPTGETACHPAAEPPGETCCHPAAEPTGETACQPAAEPPGETCGEPLMSSQRTPSDDSLKSGSSACETGETAGDPSPAVGAVSPSGCCGGGGGGVGSRVDLRYVCVVRHEPSVDVLCRPLLQPPPSQPPPSSAAAATAAA